MKIDWNPKKIAKRAALSCLRIYVALCAALYFLQDQLLYYPSSDPGLVVALGSNPNVLVTSVPTEDGKTVGRSTGTWNCLVAYFWGNAENVDYLFVDGESPYPGCVFSAMNYRGYGQSDGKPNEANMHHDSLAWFDEMERLYRPEKTVVMGRSLGTNVALYVARERPADKLVLVTPYDSIAHVAQSRYPVVPVPWLIHDSFDSASIAPDVKTDTLVLVAENDQIVPRSRTDALLASFSKTAPKVAVIPDSDHNTIVERKAYAEKLKAFLR